MRLNGLDCDAEVGRGGGHANVEGAERDIEAVDQGKVKRVASAKGTGDCSYEAPRHDGVPAGERVGGTLARKPTIKHGFGVQTFVR